MALVMDRTVHIFVGFFFLINFSIGSGFLSIPFAFFYSGYLAAIPTFLGLYVLVFINALYLLEVMARAQALEYVKTLEGTGDQDKSAASQPRFEITVSRKFEIMELCEVFFNKWVKYLYLVILCVATLLMLWGFCTVGGSSWASNIPYNFSGVLMCDSNAFLHGILPTEVSCRNAYYFSLFLFALIVITLSMFDLKEQTIIQVLLGLLRFLVILAIIIFCIVKVAQDRDACTDSISVNNTESIPLTDIVVKFAPQSWLMSIPIFLYALTFHHGISTLTHPVRQKHFLHYLVMASLTCASICYFTLGVITPLYLQAAVEETVTLNFEMYTSSKNSLPLRILAYFIVLFPSLDVASAYPLIVHVLVNHIYAVIAGHDTSIPPSKGKKWLDLSLRIGLRLVLAIIPVLAAFGVANLVEVLKFAGLTQFLISLGFPTLLQLRSIFVCRKTFASSQSTDASGQQQTKEEKQLLLSSSDDVDDDNDKKTSSLSPQRSQQKGEYLTPFSSRVISHPVTVVIVGILGLCFFLLAVGSLFATPDQTTCTTI